MNAIDNIRRAFRSKYSFDVQSTWLQACIVWLRDQYQLADLTNNYTLEKIYNQWLHTDIALIADAYSLPNDLDLNAKKVQLSGKYALQINSIICISEPYYSQVLDIHGDQNDNERIDNDITETQQWKPPPAKRVLYLDLTDGKTILRGLEYEAINGLDRDTTLPGAKILVTGPVLFRRGMLLLTSKNTQILGGYAENLLEKNASMETALVSLSKTAAKLDESRVRFDRLNIKLHIQAIANDSTNVVPTIQTNQTSTYRDEDEMDELIRQAYDDGMLNDSHLTRDPMDYNPAPSSYNTTQLTTTSITTTTTTYNRIPSPKNEPEQLILISDDDDSHLSQINNVPSSSLFAYHQYSPVPLPSPPLPPPPPVIIKVSLPYTYISIIRREKISSIIDYQDFIVKGCFSSLISNPRIVKNEFDLRAYINDGSDCIQVRLASDFLSQRIGVTATELMTRRSNCKTDLDKQKLQIDFNERLKQFGHEMQSLNTIMTLRFFSDDRVPVMMKLHNN